jgi:hypothetical protein
VERRVKGLVVPGVAAERRRRSLMKRGHGLMRLKRRPWAKDAGTGGPHRHRPGLNEPSPWVISSSPGSGGVGGELRLTTAAASAVAAAAGVAGTAALLLGPGTVGGGAAGAAAGSAGSGAG